MPERLLIVLALVVVGIGVYIAYTRYCLWQAAKTAPTDALLTHLKRGVPAILYFTMPSCIPCKTQQVPALNEIAAELGELVQIIRVDVSEDLAAAERWGILSVPTTYILDAHGKPRDVNYGVADADKLKRQLKAVSV